MPDLPRNDTETREAVMRFLAGSEVAHRARAIRAAVGADVGADPLTVNDALRSLAHDGLIRRIHRRRDGKRSGEWWTIAGRPGSTPLHRDVRAPSTQHNQEATP